MVRGHALRLGLRLVKGLTEDDAHALVLSRGAGYRDPYDLWRRARLPVAALERLARADAFRSTGLDRRAALWAVKALGDQPLPLFAGLDDPGVAEPEVALPVMAAGEHVVMDYGSLCLSLKAHPMALLRDGFTGVAPAERLRTARPGARLTVVGLALVRQRPGSASGVVFITLEDETGIANLVIMPDVFEKFRKAILSARLIAATGRVEKDSPPNEEGGVVIHLRVERIIDLTHRLNDLLDPEPARTAPSTPQSAGVFPEGRNFR